jgi:hypothetical protein
MIAIVFIRFSSVNFPFPFIRFRGQPLRRMVAIATLGKTRGQSRSVAKD